MTPPPAKRRPTIDDVAAAAGVSRGTVSRVLNGGHWVSPDSLASVNSAIKKTGYRVNPHARSLATSRANSVAFLLTESHDRLFEDPNFAVLMRGASKALSVHDISLVLIMAGNEDEQRRATEFITAGHVDGVLLVSSHSDRRGLISEIVAAGVPAIACGVPLGFERKMGYVAADDYAGARELVHHLAGLGRKRIATIAGPKDTSGGMRRFEGYADELGDDFDETLVARGDYSRASGAQSMTELLERHPDLDAVFAANDVMAAGAIDVLLASGRRVPEDVAVGGFDDAPVATQTTPPLTTMHQPFERISEEMVRLLLRVIGGERPAAIVLPTDLVVRESA
ncbi:LacI family transcriptional regulator [Cryobacterium adonitolivorans]|uniref:LacI family transcriptional regulator n=1 Tax=Cryobacterium adonitolivorans TaxID=1259189 RepID=A0A4R8W4Z3_9MICO|nr:LacI family DNA-binding transcriptional regulator [Cryobacterium adonitolivorans]TFC02363.1 LacI family transcriptional regulator [Cryobacterium adonitolivorans]